MPAFNKYVITQDDALFPRSLLAVSSPPKALFLKGNPDLLSERSLAVVGSRRVSAYGKQVLSNIVGPIASLNIPIISGFMFGVDALAHETALINDGTTIAVMPCGIDNIHPAYQVDLYTKILENGGLIVSEYDGMLDPQPWIFPKRNRIVVGLSEAVLVIEAAKKSGSVISGTLGLQYGKKVFVIPGNITSPNSHGIVDLINQGAQPVYDHSSILEHLNCPAFSSETLTKSSQSMSNSKEYKILALLQQESLSPDSLVTQLNIDISELNTLLSVLQVNGHIHSDGGKYYAS